MIWNKRRTANPERTLQFAPLGKRVVVLRKVPDMGGLSLTPELEREAHPDMGEIIKIGNIGWWNKYIRGIRPGRMICFTRYSPVAIRDEEKEHIFVELNNILGIEE